MKHERKRPLEASRTLREEKTKVNPFTSDVCGSGQGEDQGSVQLFRLGRQNRLRVVEEAGELRLHLRTTQRCDQTQSCALDTEERDAKTWR